MKRQILLLTIMFFLFSCTKTDKPTKCFIVTSYNGLLIREAPSISQKVITAIPYFEQVEIIKKEKKIHSVNNIKGQWYQIRWKKYSGWVFGGYIQELSNHLQNKLFSWGLYCTGKTHSEYVWVLHFYKKYQLEHLHGMALNTTNGFFLVYQRLQGKYEYQQKGMFALFTNQVQSVKKYVKGKFVPYETSLTKTNVTAFFQIKSCKTNSSLIGLYSPGFEEKLGRRGPKNNLWVPIKRTTNILYNP